MQQANFLEFLQYRYRACIKITIEPGLLDVYPDLIPVFFQTWNQLEQIGTAPYKFRLVFDEAPLTSEEVLSKINEYSQIVIDPSQLSKNPQTPWFTYWMNLFFLKDFQPPYLFCDMPICCIHISSSPAGVTPSFNDWCSPFTQDVQNFNIVISNSAPPLPQTYRVTEISIKGFYDIILDITHYKAAATLKSILDSTQEFVINNWQGFGNSVRRFLGFSTRVSRPTLICQLKRLGDLFLSSGDYQNAYKYYQSLYQELLQDDPPVESSLLITMAVSSLLLNEELDLKELLHQTVRERGISMHQFQAMFITAYFCITHGNPSYARKIYFYMMRRLSGKNIPFAVGASGLLLEAASFTSLHGHAAMYQGRAAKAYSGAHLLHNARICTWRAYNLVRKTGWPKLEEDLLLLLSGLCGPQPALHSVLEHRRVHSAGRVAQLLQATALDGPVEIGSVLCHDVEVLATGFPLSPAPEGVSESDWRSYRKKIFPVVYHPSADRFTASAWSHDDLDTINVGVDEPFVLKLRLTPLPHGACVLTNIRLIFDNPEIVDSESIDRLELVNGQTVVSFSITVHEPDTFFVLGAEAEWNGVAPVSFPFPNPLMFEGIENPPLLEAEVECDRTTAYPGHPVYFKLRTRLIRGELSALHAVIVAGGCGFAMVEPHAEEGQRFALEQDSTSVFAATPYPEVYGSSNLSEQRIEVFVSYVAQGSHVTRFTACHLNIAAKQLPAVKAVSAGDVMHLRYEGEVTAVEGEGCEINRIGDVIKIESLENANASVKISRRIAGIETSESVKVPQPVVKFGGSDEATFSSFPGYLECSFRVMCSHGLTMELHQPDGAEWRFIGSTKRRLKEGTSEVAVRIIALKPFMEDIGERIDLGEGCKLHHMLSVKSSI